MSMMKKLSAAVIIAGIATGAQAATETYQASMAVQNAVVLSENEAVDFATVELSAGSTCVLDNADGVTGCTVVGGTENTGSYNIAADTGEVVVISATGGNDNGAGTNITYTPYYWDGGAMQDLTSGTHTLTSTGSDDILVGGDMAQQAGVVAGSYTVDWDLTVDYQ